VWPKEQPDTLQVSPKFTKGSPHVKHVHFDGTQEYPFVQIQIWTQTQQYMLYSRARLNLQKSYIIMLNHTDVLDKQKYRLRVGVPLGRWVYDYTEWFQYNATAGKKFSVHYTKGSILLNDD
jgi:hypothetical protein